MEEDFEALFSVYSNIKILENENEDYYQIFSFSFSPRDEFQEISFLELELLFLIPRTYPEISPSIEIIKISGISEEEEEIKKRLIQQINLYIKHEFKSGEIFLLQLFEEIYQIIERESKRGCNNECLICLQGLKQDPFPLLSTTTTISTNATKATQLIPQTQITNQPISLKTNCYHYFHISCLSRWACYYFDITEHGLETRKNNEQLNVTLRSLQGEVKSIESQIKRYQEELLLLHEQIQQTQLKINQFHDSNSLIEGLKQQMIQINLQMSKASGKKKQKLYDNYERIRIQLQLETEKLNKNEKVETIVINTNEDDETIEQLTERLRELQKSSLETEGKLKKYQIRYEII